VVLSWSCRHTLLSADADQKAMATAVGHDSTVIVALELADGGLLWLLAISDGLKLP
jgi:hypothetical protein